MNEKQLSIIIPIYQTEKYLESCLESVVKSVSTEQSVEVLLIDDGSKDGSAEICKSFASKFPYFRYICKENEGVSKTRNVGLHISKGRYIHFLDSDDFLHQDFIRSIIRYVSTQSFNVCFFEYEDLPQKENAYAFIRSNRASLFVNGEQSGVDVLKKIMSSNKQLSSVCASIYSKTFLTDNLIEFDYRLSSSEDVDFINKCLLKARKVVYQDITSVIYRRYREGSATNTYSNEKIICDLKVRKKWFDYSQTYDLQPINYYPNEFVEFLYRCDITSENFNKIIEYLIDNTLILDKTISKKAQLLKIFLFVFGKKYGLKYAIKFINRK